MQIDADEGSSPSLGISKLDQGWIIMEILYTFEETQNRDSCVRSIFLAGPTIRDESLGLVSWRDHCIELLSFYGYDGIVYCPETPVDPIKRQFFDNEMASENGYGKRIDWEIKHLNDSNLILFWIARDLKTLPGFTTNIEFGEFMHSGKVLIGIPPTAEKCEYIKYRCQKDSIPVFETMIEMVKHTMLRIKGFQPYQIKSYEELFAEDV